MFGYKTVQNICLKLLLWLLQQQFMDYEIIYEIIKYIHPVGYTRSFLFTSLVLATPSVVEQIEKFISFKKYNFERYLTFDVDYQDNSTSVISNLLTEIKSYSTELL